ncbi:MAG: hypothetical protein ABSA70_11025 [Terriglobia bacterium]
MKAFPKHAGPMLAGLLALSPLAAAQQSTGAPVTVEYYYQLVPGGAQEWLALYKKNHNPILQQLMKEGLIKSEKLYERRFHAAKPAWDFKVVMVWRDWAALEEASRREPEVIRSLYPDKPSHDREEKRRWELTVAHWDDVLREVPLE